MRTSPTAVLMLFGLLTAISSTFGQTWMQAYQSSIQWAEVASTADGSLLIAINTNGPVWFSTNSGYQWFDVKWKNSYYSTAVCSSEDGSVLAVTTGHSSAGPIFIATNSITNWTATIAPSEYWSAIACSADGSQLVAAATNGAIYISTNTGNTWNPSSAPNEDWISIASSADGSQLVAVATNGPICVSTNAGSTWTTNSTTSSSSAAPVSPSYRPEGESSSLYTNWQAVACSADKTKLVAIVNGGPIYISTNAGATWTRSSAPSTNWQAVACSADGSKLVAADENGPIYTSADGGTTWITNSVPNSSWVSVATSADGSKIVAATGVTQFRSTIYTCQSIPVPQLNLITANNNFAFSWVMPSTNFVMQQNLDLTTTNWVTLTNSPRLNLSNLQDQVCLSPSNNTAFFRLILQ